MLADIFCFSDKDVIVVSINVDVSDCFVSVDVM